MKHLILLLALVTAACAGGVGVTGPERPEVSYIPGPDDIHDEPQLQ